MKAVKNKLGTMLTNETLELVIRRKELEWAEPESLPRAFLNGRVTWLRLRQLWYHPAPINPIKAMNNAVKKLDGSLSNLITNTLSGNLQHFLLRSSQHWLILSTMWEEMTSQLMREKTAEFESSAKQSSCTLQDRGKDFYASAFPHCYHRYQCWQV